MSVKTPTAVGENDCATDYLIVSAKCLVSSSDCLTHLVSPFQIAGGGTEAQAKMLTPPRAVGQTRYCGRRFNVAGATVNARVCCKYF